MKHHANVTLSLPEDLMREFRVFAAQHGQSMTAIMAQAISEKMERESGAAQQAKRRFLARMRRGFNLGTGGRASWTREELHERGGR